MFMWPQHFPWRTIIGRHRPAVLNLHTIEISWFWGLNTPQIQDKITVHST